MKKGKWVWSINVCRESKTLGPCDTLCGRKYVDTQILHQWCEFLSKVLGTSISQELGSRNFPRDKNSSSNLFPRLGQLVDQSADEWEAQQSSAKNTRKYLDSLIHILESRSDIWCWNRTGKIIGRCALWKAEACLSLLVNVMQQRSVFLCHCCCVSNENFVFFVCLFFAVRLFKLCS